MSVGKTLKQIYHPTNVCMGMLVGISSLSTGYLHLPMRAGTETTVMMPVLSSVSVNGQPINMSEYGYDLNIARITPDNFNTILPSLHSGGLQPREDGSLSLNAEFTPIPTTYTDYTEQELKSNTLAALGTMALHFLTATTAIGLGVTAIVRRRQRSR